MAYLRDVSLEIRSVAEKIAEQNLALNKGEKIVITGGNTSGVSGTTNLIKIEDI